jgi:hypothetical protein
MIGAGSNPADRKGSESFRKASDPHVTDNCHGFNESCRTKAFYQAYETCLSRKVLQLLGKGVDSVCSCADASVAHEVGPVEKVRAAGPMAANEDGAAAAARRW